MKLATDNNTLATNKILILYILNKVNKPLSNEALLKLVLSITDMNYFYFQQFLLDLIESKYLATLEDESTLYAITDAGKEVLNLTENIIPGILKLNVDNKFKENLSTINNELSVSADFIPEGEHEYTVICKIIENNRTLFEIKTFAGSREQAKSIVDNWNDNASELYLKMLNLLVE